MLKLKPGMGVDTSRGFRLHRTFHGLSIWDLTYAGKRGKIVDGLNVYWGKDIESGGQGDDLVAELAQASGYKDAVGRAKAWPHGETRADRKRSKEIAPPEPAGKPFVQHGLRRADLHTRTQKLASSLPKDDTLRVALEAALKADA
jgi:hypothetical protein